MFVYLFVAGLSGFWRWFFSWMGKQIVYWGQTISQTQWEIFLI